jgi:excisionase family DNA binding protein
MTTTEAAAALGVKRVTIIKRIYKCQLTACKVGRDWNVDPASVASFVRKLRGYPKGRPRK